MPGLDPAIVGQMISAVTKPLEADGASVEVVQVADDRVTLEYRHGTCEECDMHPDDLAAIVLEMVSPQLPALKHVQVNEISS